MRTSASKNTQPNTHSKSAPTNKSRIPRYGWIPDLPDHRDHAFSAGIAHLKALPPRMDLRSECPAVYDQGDLGSCTANAIAAAIEFDRLKQRLPDFVPSRLFIYYNERAMEHSIASDSGAQIRDGVKSVAKQGVCPESDWPYDVSKFAIKPAPVLYENAVEHRALSYQRVTRSLSQMRGCLAAGFPFILGFTVYTAFESREVEKTGALNLPSPREKMLGGHAVLAVGYDDGLQRFIVRNSWGSDWGQEGYFTMPYAYLLSSSLSSDFWTIRMVE
jgi:C1A family cysteine protease